MVKSLLLCSGLLAGAAVFAADNNPVVAQRADYSCRRLENAFRFRGNPDDWKKNGALPLFLNGPENRAMPDWNGPDDVAVTLYLLHDETFFYVAGLVTDAHPKRRATGGELYRGSGFQMAFDPLDDTLVPGYDGNDIEIGFGQLADGRAVAHCWVGGEKNRNGEWPDVAVQVTRLPDGRDFYEAAVPWTRLAPFDLNRQKHFGFNILYNAAGADGIRRGWLHWTPGIGEEKLAFMFRNVRLTPPGIGRAEPVITTDRGQYASGDVATVTAWIPTADTAAPLEARFEILEDRQVIHHETRTVDATPGGCELQFTYETGRLRGSGLGVRLVTTQSGEKIELNTEILNLSASLLLERAALLKQRSAALREQLSAAAGQGIPIDYPQVAVAVCDITLRHRAADLADPARLTRYALLPRINRQFDVLEHSLEHAGAELDSLRADPAARRRVPRIPMANLTVRDGAFYFGDTPVILIGPHGWWEVYPDIALIAEAGFNLIGGTLVAADATPAPDKTRQDFGRTIRRHLETMHQHNLAYDFLVSPHPLPDGWKKAHPEMTEFSGGGWIGSSFYIPATRRMVDAMWATLLPIVRDMPNLVSLNLVNEWSFSDGLRQAHPEMLRRFRAQMRTRYGTIGKLNAVWQSNWSDFDAIDPLTLKRGTPGGFYDWESFRYAEGLENIRFLRDTAEKYAPGKLRQIKTIAVTDLSPEQYTPVGAERELRGELMDIAGSDCAGTLQLDYYRSLVPDKPASDTEFHVAAGITPAEIVTDAWSAVLHGEGMRQYFVWASGYSAETMVAGAMLHIPEALEALGRTALDIRRLTPEIIHFPRAIAEAQVGILYSPASLYCAPDYPAALRRIHAELSHLDAPVRFISERQLGRGQFGQLRLIVVPGARYVLPETVAALARFTADGGRVVATGDALRADPWNRPLSALPPVEQLPADPNFDRLLTAAQVERPVRLAENPPGIELRSVRSTPGETLFYLINYGPARTIQPLLDGRNIAAARELITAREVHFPLELPSRQPQLFLVKK